MPKYILARKATVVAQAHISSQEYRQPWRRAAELFVSEYQPGDQIFIEMGDATYTYIEELLKNDTR